MVKLPIRVRCAIGTSPDIRVPRPVLHIEFNGVLCTDPICSVETLPSRTPVQFSHVRHLQFTSARCLQFLNAWLVHFPTTRCLHMHKADAYISIRAVGTARNCGVCILQIRFLATLPTLAVVTIPDLAVGTLHNRPFA
jgi:hypothetical protein